MKKIEKNEPFNFDPVYHPSPQEIAEMCAQFQRERAEIPNENQGQRRSSKIEMIQTPRTDKTPRTYKLHYEPQTQDRF